MEEINEGIKHILSFLHVVEDSVDDYRQSLGQAYQKEYHAFVENWRKANKQKKQIQNSELEPDIQVKSEIVCQPINIEELDHADQLLEKARKIRKQVSEKRNESNVRFLDSKCDRNRATNKKLSSQTGQEREITSSKLKSDYHKGAISKYKIPACPEKQPKTTYGHQTNMYARGAAKPLRPSKEPASAHHKSSGRTISTATSKSKPPSHLLPAVVSNEAFLSLKNLCIADTTLHSTNLTADMKDNSKTMSPFPLRNEKAGISEITVSQKHLPTHREFHKVLNDFLKERKQPFRLDKKWAWYMYLGSKEEVRMSQVISCNSYEDLKKAHLLLTAMQESMFWLDLFYLIKTEICPHLQKLDKNERYTMQVIQCLKDICSADYTPSAMAYIN